MNKRQRKKRFKKILERIPAAQEALGKAVAEHIRDMLSRPSILGSVFTFTVAPSLNPPWQHAADETGLVHWTGWNTREFATPDATASSETRRLRVCDFEEIPDMSVTEDPVTCVRCTTYQHERMNT